MDKETRILDIFKKVVNTGIGAAFLTEDMVRGLLSELPVPKEMINQWIQNAKTSKGEILQSLKKELSHYLEQLDLHKEIDRILAKYDIELTTSVRFKPRESPPKGKVKKAKRHESGTKIPK